MTKEMDSATLLREHGLKATPRRIYLLSLLARTKEPLGAHELKALWKQDNADVVTLYRALEALADAGIVRRVNLRHGHTDYELSAQGEHHHHLVCTDCGVIEDVEIPAEKVLEKQALAHSSRFASLSEHALEFFGTCKACAA